jgi:hypothetical protein
MRTELQNLIYERISELAEETDTLVTGLTLKAIDTSAKINPDKDIYPINGKLRQIKNWADALLEENE